MYRKKQQTIKSGESSSLGRPSRKGKAAAKQKMFVLVIHTKSYYITTLAWARALYTETDCPLGRVSGYHEL